MLPKRHKQMRAAQLSPLAQVSLKGGPALALHNEHVWLVADLRQGKC